MLELKNGIFVGLGREGELSFNSEFVNLQVFPSREMSQPVVSVEINFVPPQKKLAFDFPVTVDSLRVVVVILNLLKLQEQIVDEQFFKEIVVIQYLFFEVGSLVQLRAVSLLEGGFNLVGDDHFEVGGVMLKLDYGIHI